MSIEKLNSNTNTLPLDKRIAILCDRKAIDGKSLAAIIGISPQYLTDIRHEKKLKGIPIKFWRGVQQHFPEWEPFLRGETEAPPEKDLLLDKNTPSLAQIAAGYNKGNLARGRKCLEAVPEIVIETFTSDDQALKDALVKMIMLRRLTNEIKEFLYGDSAEKFFTEDPKEAGIAQEDRAKHPKP